MQGKRTMKLENSLNIRYLLLMNVECTGNKIYMPAHALVKIIYIHLRLSNPMSLVLFKPSM